MIEWLLQRAVQLEQYGQGIGVGHTRTADKLILRQVKSSGPPPVIFDVGANRGQFLQLALIRPAVIHAFEPSKAAFAELTKGFSGRSNVFLNHLALSSEAGQRALYYDAPGSELSSLYPRQIEHHGIQFTQSETVAVDTLDYYCNAHNIRQIDLLKLDVEGHELEVLKGGAQMFEHRQIGMVSFEFGGCHVDARTYLRDFFHFFAACNMQLARVNALGGLCPLRRYEESLEQFRTTCYLATALENSS